MDKIKILIAYCKKNGGTIMFPKPLRVSLYQDRAGTPDLLGLKINDEELYIIDKWQNYANPMTRILKHLYFKYVEAVCDCSIRWFEENQLMDKNLF